MDDAYQERIVKEAAEYAGSVIAPRASEFDRQGALPRDFICDFAKAGYLAAPFPKEYGGLGLDPLYYGRLTEEIGKACPATRTLLTVHTSLVGETLVRWGSAEQKKKLLPRMAVGDLIAAFGLSEPDVGSNARGVQTQYRKEADRYIIRGTKKWISLGGIADLFVIIASCDNAVSAFLVERGAPGVVTRPISGMLAGRATYISEVELADVVLEKGAILGKEGGGFDYIVNTALDFGRYSIAWAGVGLAQAALELMVTYARTRSQFGEKLHGHQLVQGMIGDSVTRTHAARALCLSAAEQRKSGGHNAVIETTIAKYFTSRAAMEVAHDAVQVLGANGCCDQYPAERLFREARVLEIIEGTSQIQQQIIARYGLSEYYAKKV